MVEINKIENKKIRKSFWKCENLEKERERESN